MVLPAAYLVESAGSKSGGATERESTQNCAKCITYEQSPVREYHGSWQFRGGMAETREKLRMRNMSNARAKVV